MNTAVGYLDRLRNPSLIPDFKKVRSSSVASSGVPVVGAYYTNLGAGVAPEKEYWQLVDGYKSWTYTCLQSRQKVLLFDGSYLSIKQIVEKRYSGDAMSFNVASGTLERKRIIGWHKSPRGDRKWLKVSYRLAELYRGNHSKMGVVVTDDHRILTDRGYVEAGQLTKEHKVATRFVVPNKEQRKLLVGMLLGDASVGRYLTFGHTVAQGEWLDLKISGLRGIDFRVKDHPPKKWSKESRSAASTNSPFWYQMRRDWYDGRIKRLPKDLCARDLTPLALAAWYMDDGSLHKPRGFYLCSESFTRAENKRLLSMLIKKGIVGGLTSGKKCRIYVGNGRAGKGKPKDGSAIRFFRMVAPYLPSSMRYKLPLEILSDPKYNFQPSLWDIGRAEILFDNVRVGKSSRRDATAYCIDVEDNHNFISKGIVCHNCID